MFKSFCPALAVNTLYSGELPSGNITKQYSVFVLIATGALKLIVVAADPSVDTLICEDFKCTLLNGNTLAPGLPLTTSLNSTTTPILASFDEKNKSKEVKNPDGSFPKLTALIIKVCANGSPKKGDIPLNGKPKSKLPKPSPIAFIGHPTEKFNAGTGLAGTPTVPVPGGVIGLLLT